jgi:hypothetical protein
MTRLVLLKTVEKCLPGYIERETVIGYRSQKKIDWLIRFESRIYVDCNKMRAWAQRKGKLVVHEFDELEQVWGFDLHLQEHAGNAGA